MKKTGLLLDCARRFYSLDELKQVVQKVADLGGHYVQLHFCDAENYCIESNVLGNRPSATVLSFADIRALSDYATSLNIELIPELELPAHCNKMLDLLFNHNWDLWNGARTHEGGYQLHLGSPETYQLVKDLLTELLSCFTNAKTVHLGGDEFEYGTENTKTNVCNFFNNLSLWLIEKDIRTRVWNDFITKDIITGGLLNKRIQIVYWSQTGEATPKSEVEATRLRDRATMTELLNDGFSCWNSTAWFAYAVPNANEWNSHNGDYAARDIYRRWDLSISGYQNTFTRSPVDNVLGSMFCIWSEHAVHASLTQILTFRAYHIKALFDITNSYNTSDIVTASQLLEASYDAYIIPSMVTGTGSFELMGNSVLNLLDDATRTINLVPWEEVKRYSIRTDGTTPRITGSNLQYKNVTFNHAELYVPLTEMQERDKMIIRFEKIVSKLPTELEPNTIYFVRVGTGFDLYVTDMTGKIANTLNLPKGVSETPTPRTKSWIEYITEYQYQQGIQLADGAMKYMNESLEPNTVYRLIKNNVDYILDRPSLEGATILAKRGL
jgi:hexosaminidase